MTGETVKWKDSAGDVSPLTLAGESDNVEEFNIDGEQATQVVESLRADNAQAKNRGNIAHAIEINVAYASAASPQAARTAIATLIAALKSKKSTAVLLDYAYTVGATTVTLRLSNCALRGYRFRQSGTTVRGSFSFIGGDLASV